MPSCSWRVKLARMQWRERRVEYYPSNTEKYTTAFRPLIGCILYGMDYIHRFNISNKMKQGSKDLNVSYANAEYRVRKAGQITWKRGI